MHNLVFRSYDLIVTSSGAELIRDARLDVDKARSKIKSIQQQSQRDRKHAAARDDLPSALGRVRLPQMHSRYELDRQAPSCPRNSTTVEAIRRVYPESKSRDLPQKAART
jgi:hypothetical protein